MMFISCMTSIKISAYLFLIKVNYRLFLLDVYGVQYDDYEVDTLLPLDFTQLPLHLTQLPLHDLWLFKRGF